MGLIAVREGGNLVIYLFGGTYLINCYLFWYQCCSVVMTLLRLELVELKVQTGSELKVVVEGKC